MGTYGSIKKLLKNAIEGMLNAKLKGQLGYERYSQLEKTVKQS